MKNKFCIFYLFLFHGVLMFGQAPDIIWQKSFGGSGWDQSYAIKQTIDSGFIVAGYVASNDGDVIENNGLYDFWLLKLDNSGEIEWQRSYGGSSYDVSYDVQITNDGGYILAGGSQSFDGDVTGNHGADYWVVKTDNVGNIEWQKCYGGSGYDEAESIKQTIDAGFIIIGKSGSDDGDVTGHHGGLESDYWVVKIDALGTIEWQKSLGSDEDDIAYDIIQTYDGGFVAVGGAEGGGDVTINHGFWDYWVVKLDNDGELIWEKSFGGSVTDYASAIMELENGDLLVTGTTFSDDYDVTGFHGGCDVWNIKLDSSGNLKWQKTYGGTLFEAAYSGIETSESNNIFVGLAESTDGDLTENKGLEDFWIFQADTLGNLIWQKTFGGSDYDEIFCIQQTIDENFIVCGHSRSDNFDLTFNQGDFDYWIIELAVCNTHWYLDMDEDGFGALLIDSISCFMPSGYVADSTDCDDTNNLIYPGAEEICNYLDDDCDGIIDDNLSYIHSYQDADGDDYGNIEIDSLACTIPDGFVEDDSDCDDTNPAIYPGAEETLNGVDDNCNELIDEGLAIENNLLNEIKIYPNPAIDILQIDYSGNETGEIQILNIAGKNIYSDKLTAHLTINIQNLPAGIYLLKIISTENQGVFNFVKE